MRASESSHVENWASAEEVVEVVVDIWRRRERVRGRARSIYSIVVVMRCVAVVLVDRNRHSSGNLCDVSCAYNVEKGAVCAEEDGAG